MLRGQYKALLVHVLSRVEVWDLIRWTAAASLQLRFHEVLPLGYPRGSSLVGGQAAEVPLYGAREHLQGMDSGRLKAQTAARWSCCRSAGGRRFFHRSGSRRMSFHLHLSGSRLPGLSNTGRVCASY